MSAGTISHDGHHATPAATAAEENLPHPLQAMPEFLRLGQVTDVIGWKRTTIYAMCDDGVLHYHESPGRGLKRRLITRASVALYLARHTNYGAAQVGALFRLALPSLDRAGLLELRAAVAAELTGGEAPAA